MATSAITILFIHPFLLKKIDKLEKNYEKILPHIENKKNRAFNILVSSPPMNNFLSCSYSLLEP